MDRLSQLLQDLELNAEVFFSGRLCGIKSFDDDRQSGYLHLLQSGTLILKTDQGHQIKMDEGSVIFFPCGTSHQIEIHPSEEARMVCATVKIPPAPKAKLIEHLPKFLCFNAADNILITETAQGIFKEAFTEKHGRQIMIDRLCDIFMVHILRYVIDKGTLELGLIAAEAHPQLAALIQAVQQKPQHEWSIDEMAEQAAMSRSKFSALFKETVGQAPMEYVTGLRMAMARGLLKKNRPVGLVANDVGYENASSLAKVFKKHFGVTPKQWIKSYLSSK